MDEPVSFKLNDEAINFVLNFGIVTSGTVPPVDGPILMGDTDVFWGSTTVTFDHA